MLHAAPADTARAAQPRRAGLLASLLPFMVVVFLFLAAADPFKFIGYAVSRADAADGTLKMLVWAGVYFAFALPFLLCFRQIAWLWTRSIWLLLLYGLLAASVFWSPSFGSGLQAAAAPLGTALVASVLAVYLDECAMIKACALALMLCALASIGAVLLMPDYGVMGGRHEGLWRGITGQKNTLAQIMLAGVFLCFLTSQSAQGFSRTFYRAGIALCALCLLMAGSATAVLVGIACALTASAVWLLRRSQGTGHGRAFLGLFFTFALLIAALLGVQLTQFGLELLGRDASLTDRIPLWNGVLAAIADRPWLGWGYGQFWSPTQGIAIGYVREFLLWDAPHAHNGWLELALNLGWIGVMLFALSLIAVLRRLYTLVLHPQAPEYKLAVLAVVLLLLLNLTEAAMVTGANILWVIYLYSALRLPLLLHNLSATKVTS